MPPSAIGETAKAREVSDLKYRCRRTARETGHGAVKVRRLIRDVLEEIEDMLAKLKRDSISAGAKALVQSCVAPEHPGVCEHDRHIAQRP